MKQRLINCDFLLNGSFAKLPNKTKLLYLMLFFHADDRGFVGNAELVVDDLEKNDSEYDKSISLELIQTTYQSAITDLVNQGYLFEFRDNHSNSVYLIRHFFYHNKYYSKAWTNYKRFLRLVKLVDNEYVMRGSEEDIGQEEEQVLEQPKPKETPKSRDEILKDLDNGGEEDDTLPWNKILEQFPEDD